MANLEQETLTSHKVSLPLLVCQNIYQYIQSPADRIRCLSVNKMFLHAGVEVIWYLLKVASPESWVKIHHVLTQQNQSVAYSHYIRELDFSYLSHTILVPKYSLARSKHCKNASYYLDPQIPIDLVSMTMWQRLISLNMSECVFAEQTLAGLVAKLSIEFDQIQCISNNYSLEQDYLTSHDRARDNLMMLKSTKRDLDTDDGSVKNLFYETSIAETAVSRNSNDDQYALMRYSIWNGQNRADISDYAKSLEIQNTFSHRFLAPPDSQIQSSFSSPANLHQASLTRLIGKDSSMIVVNRTHVPQHGSKPFSSIHIKYLNLSGCSDITSTTLAMFIQRLTGLEALVVDKVSAVNCSVLKSIPSTLIGIWMRQCSQVCDDGIIALAKNASNLQDVHWAQSFDRLLSNTITDLALITLAKAAPNLHTFEFTGLSRLTDATIRALEISCRQLQSVNVSNCYALNITPLQSLIRTCTDLSFLCIYGCDKVIYHWSAINNPAYNRVTAINSMVSDQQQRSHYAAQEPSTHGLEGMDNKKDYDESKQGVIAEGEYGVFQGRAQVLQLTW
ncbi:hypothetical protein BDV3_004115 [Batrachochytrium dendrobatidis]|uniref:F-box domain-containing protein n=1 Tax=Batrachochytrium dendrobatidis (strain JEL423) TaxID=403673 RepID=A0A177WEU9_BATDL|nr:hypothetical protein BDEG_22549 [Batrachochytrium dendrobatidis JEL423]